MKRVFPIHIFLIAWFFIVSPMMMFTRDIPPALAARILFVSVPVNLALLGVLWLITRDLQHSAFVGMLLWISLGLTSMPLLVGVPNWIISVTATWIVLLVLWALIAVLVLPRRVWRSVKDPSWVTRFLNIIGACSISYSAFMMISTTIRLEEWKVRHAEWLAAKVPVQQATTADSPDIYYIVLDGYGREDVLRERFGTENAEFLDPLTEMGFYIADEGRSNYSQTVLSMSSSLNLQYLDEQIGMWGDGSGDRNPPTEMIHHSLARAFLEARGYRMVNIFSGFYSTEIPDADERRGQDRPYGMNYYEQNLVLYSPLQEFLPKDQYGYPLLGYDAHRQRLVQGLESLAQLAAESGPKFVFAHILAGHPPFVLREDGSSVEENRPFKLVDGDRSYDLREEYVSGYVAQIGYVNRRLLEIIPMILRKGNRPAVIILQGDHGPGSAIDFFGTEGSCLWERTSILNAYYLPEEYRAGLYPSITPVNTFRLIFRNVFGADFPPLKDMSFYSSWAKPYQLRDIGDQITVSCPS